MTHRRFIRLQRRIHGSQRHPTIKFLFLFALAIFRLPPSGVFAYVSAKRLQLKGLSAAKNIRLRSGRVILLRDTDTDLSIFEQIILLGDCSIPWKTPSIRHIIDAGAHIGSSSLFFASRYPGARILAVECDPGNFAQLVKNTAGHPFITPIHAAVFSRSTRVAIINPGDQAWGFRVEEIAPSAAASTESVSAHTLPELMKIAGFPSIDLLKLDIEGAERDIFAAETEAWLPRVGLIIVELHDHIKPGCSENFAKAVENIPHRIDRQMQNTLWQNLA